MLSAKLGHVFDKPLGSLARKIPLHPNTLSLIGFIITLLAAYMLTKNLRIGGVLILVGGGFDVLDGVVARVHKKSSTFGAFLDSVLDRYSDAFILMAIALYVGRQNDISGVLLCVGILVGAFLISYTRARAEGLGEECRHGLMERPERIILISFGAITGLLAPVLWIMLILTHVTVVQRIYYVWRRTSVKSH